jgi:hypothetical protein
MQRKWAQFELIAIQISSLTTLHPIDCGDISETDDHPFAQKHVCLCEQERKG